MGDDLISRNALKDALWEKEWSIYPPIDDIDDVIDMQPAVDAEPVKYGRIVEDWKDRKKGTIKRVFTCCNTDFTDLTQWMRPRYCPDCGAKIEGETERKWLSQES